MHGTLSEGACYRDSLIGLSTPGNPCVGFGCYTEEGAVRNDGRYLYIVSGSGNVMDSLRVFTPDPFTFVRTGSTGNWEYPADTELNDAVVPTPLCTSGLQAFMLYPDTGDALYRCQSGQGWNDATGVITRLGTKTLVWPGNAGRLLAENGSALELVAADGTVTPVTGLPSEQWVAYRAVADGFYVATMDSSTGAGSRWQILADGTSFSSATWTGVPSGTRVAYGYVMGAAGDLYCQGTDTVNTGVDIVLRFPAGGGVATVAYTEDGLEQQWSNGAKKPDTMLHVSKLVSGF